MAGFLRNYFLRQSCYNCNFRLYEKNTADIILGDFWGIGEECKSFDDDKGVSAVVVNSKKGADIFEEIENKIICRKVDIEQIAKHNVCLKESVLLNKNRFDFFDLFDRMGVILSVNYLTKREDLGNLRNQLWQSEENVKQAEKQFEQIREKFLQTESELSKVINSRKWRLIIKLVTVFSSVFPHGSLRRKILRMGYKGTGKILSRNKKQ